VSQRPRKYSPEFRQYVLERLKDCQNLSALARELGMPRKWLYVWRKPPPNKPKIIDEPSTGPRPCIQALERLVDQQAVEIDFFKGALQRLEERRRKRDGISSAASTSKSST